MRLHGCRYKGVFLGIEIGDLTRENRADAIIIPMNAEGQMAGGISLAIKGVGGKEIEDELKKYVPIDLGKSVITAAGKLGVKGIIHAITMPHPMSRETSNSVVARAIQHSLKNAEIYGHRKVAMPTFGTGFGLWDYNRSAKVMMEAIGQYIVRGSKLEEIRIIGYEKVSRPTDLAEFVRSFDLLYARKSVPAVVVIDMIEDFVGEGKIIKTEASVELVKNINLVTGIARERKVPVIFIIDSHDAESDWEFVRVAYHALRQRGQDELVSGLIAAESDKRIFKTRYSGFYKTSLESLLQELNANTLILVGNQTNVCVQNTALDAFYRGYRVVVPKQCVESAHHEMHEYALRYIERYIGEVTDIQCIPAIL